MSTSTCFCSSSSSLATSPLPSGWTFDLLKVDLLFEAFAEPKALMFVFVSHGTYLGISAHVSEHIGDPFVVVAG